MGVASLADLFSLSGKVALVTGARTGLGRGCAEALAAAGADILGAGPRPMPETEAAVTGMGRRFTYLPVDLADRAAARRLATEAVAVHGRVDVLVNNSGIIRRADLSDYTDEDWDAVTTVNLDSLFVLSQGIATHMREAGIAGRIVNIASLLAVQGGIRVVAYTAAKHAVAGVTKAMANELAPHGITVNASAPGYMDTDNTAALRADPARTRQIMDRVPVGRWGLPSDLATAVVFLAAPASGFVTGVLLPVDGGWLAR
ncbi:MAG: 2-dehydro-3-deoxy-D-gluconate 5-dehydrogenase KduD [Rhodospirillales bacterium]